MLLREAGELPAEFSDGNSCWKDRIFSFDIGTRFEFMLYLKRIESVYSEVPL